MKDYSLAIILIAIAFVFIIVGIGLALAIANPESKVRTNHSETLGGEACSSDVPGDVFFSPGKGLPVMAYTSDPYNSSGCSCRSRCTDFWR